MNNDNESILLPGGGYEQLKSYQKSLVIYDGTVCFTQRFLKSADRTIDQMIQAARSGKQNIIEGSMASVISKETEIKLTGVARASLAELLEDYKDYLRIHHLPLWDKDSTAAQAVRKLAYHKIENYEIYRPYLENRSDGTCANIMICLIHQCTYLLRKQLEKLTAEFPQHGGIRERMTQARLNYRNKQK